MEHRLAGKRRRMPGEALLFAANVCELHDARGIARADVSGAVENNFSLRHEQTTWRRRTQSVRCWTL